MIRAATPEDVPFLWRVLALAASTDGSEAAIAAARADPMLAAYLVDFPRATDLAFVAEERGLPIGAAWVRTGEPGGGKVWTASAPELVIATVPECRAAGVGSRLLEAVIAAARGRYEAITLTVRDGNPAVRLYERCGFVRERELVNRVGGKSVAMRLGL